MGKHREGWKLPPVSTLLNRLRPKEDRFGRITRFTQERFPYSYGFMPAYTNGLSLLPPDHKHLAIVVPIDGEYVLATPRRRHSFASIEREFAGQEAAYFSSLQEITSCACIEDLPDRDLDGMTPFFPNSYFGPMDASVLTGIIGRFQAGKVP